MLSTSIIGTPFWAAHVANVCLDQRFCASAVHGLRKLLPGLPGLLRSKRVIVLGQGFPDTTARKIWFILIVTLWAINRQRHICFYWIGSEVYRSAPQTRFVRAYLRLARHHRVHHICGATWFQDPLKSAGIDAVCIVFPYDTGPAKAHTQQWPATQQLHVVTYLTPSHWDNSNGGWVKDATIAKPDVQWSVIGMTKEQAPKEMRSLSNVKFHGWVDDPATIIAQGHLFVRLTINDAYAGTVRDAQSMRRIVMFTKPVTDIVAINQDDQNNFTEAFESVRLAFANNDEGTIAKLRSNGDHVPDFCVCSKELSNFVASPQ